MVGSGSSSTVGSVRLRLPAVRVREDTTSRADEPEAAGPGGSGTVAGETDAAGAGVRGRHDGAGPARHRAAGPRDRDAAGRTAAAAPGADHLRAARAGA